MTEKLQLYRPINLDDRLLQKRVYVGRREEDEHRFIDRRSASNELWALKRRSNVVAFINFSAIREANIDKRKKILLLARASHALA